MSGATNLFIKLSCLPDAIRQRIIEFKNDSTKIESPDGLKKHIFLIVGVTSSVDECCVVASFKIIFGSWSGNHDFIVTESLHGKEMIIGRDFMKLHNAIIDHGKDLITLDKPKMNQEEFSETECELSKSIRSNSRIERSCTVLNSVTIEPRCEQFVHCKVDQARDQETLFFCPDANDSGVHGAYSINYFNENGEFYVKPNE